MRIAHLEFQLDDSVFTRRTLRCRVGELDVQVFLNRAAEKVRSEIDVPGFRKGRAPLSAVRKHHAAWVETIAFGEIKEAALKQVLEQLEEKDKPFLPPESAREQKVRVRYGKPLEFSVSYLVDPSGIAKNPEGPGQGADPVQALHERASRTVVPGIPLGPVPPSIPAAAPGPTLPE